ncbi:prominin-2 [Callorhinchus milii]|uniref:prominin-2 n=1 Tax=Callorhinchus milii TaxID=7868 RepID=UPI001C3FC3F9|nr:prominin-2 [Callorhinchus milii]XP_007903883.2 prominin-2 [Callorhinchus milii]
MSDMASHQHTASPHLTISRLWPLICVFLTCFPQSVISRTCQSTEQKFHRFPQVTYSDNPNPDPGGLTALYSMVHTFLNMVQPNPFPADLIQSLIEDVSDFEDHYIKILEYQIGYLVCAAIGILFFCLMPIVGMFFCCCRCCGLCGGKMYHKQTKSVNCKRRGLAIGLSLVTTFMLAGNICTFISNEKVTNAVRGSASLLNNTVDDLGSFLNTIPTQITEITNASSVPINKVSHNLDNIGEILGGEVLHSLGTTMYPALNSASQLAQDVNDITRNLQLVRSTSGTLQVQLATVTSNLTAIQQELDHTIINCSPACDSAKPLLTDLVVIPNFNKIANLDLMIQNMEKVMKLELNVTVQKGYKAFNDTPALITNQSATTVVEVKEKLKNIEQQINSLTQDIPVFDVVNSVNSELNKIVFYLNEYLPKVEEINLYRWIAGIVLCCIILLVLLLNYLGLLLGTLGIKRNVNPTKRSCTANCGGQLLMSGVGLSFIFSWILMILIFILFFVGGNIYSLICKPWNSQELLQFIDTPGVIPNFNLAETLGLQNVTLNISSIYNDCRNNTPLWAALHLEQAFDLDQYLNLSKYKEEINKTFDKMDVDLSGITLLNSEGKEALTNLSKAGLSSLNFTSMAEQLKQPVTRGDLQEAANQLQSLSSSMTVSVKDKLIDLSERLRKLNSWIISNIQPNMVSLNYSVQYLQRVTPHTESTASTTLNRIESAQSALLTDAPSIITAETSFFLDCQLDYFDQYLQWTRTAITQEMAQCLPAADAIDATETIACTYIVNSLNAFWFSLGWCTIFFIPSIILAVMLAKYYRRMDMADDYEYEGSNMELVASQPAPAFKFPRANVYN